MSLLEELKARKIFRNITNEGKLLQVIKNKKKALYTGFDPTAVSLHVGNYAQIMVLNLFKKHGFQAYALVGGATGFIGDPSGKDAERKLLDKKSLLKNKELITNQLKSFNLQTEDNFSFYENTTVLDFLTKAGKQLNVNYMLNKEVVSNRIESGISFTEFSYQVIQGWDFYTMYKKNHVQVQVGGSDQWGNITTGIEIIRKKIGANHQAVGITTNLLTTNSGEKFGKSEENALFLNKNLTKPFEIYQYFLNVTDSEVEHLLLWLTHLEILEVGEVMGQHLANPKDRIAQKVLAHEIVKDIHCEEEALRAEETSALLFGKSKRKINSYDLNNLAKTIQTLEAKDQNILDLLLEVKVCSSKREAREFLASGGLKINNEGDFKESQKASEFLLKPNNKLLVRKGTKRFLLVKILDTV